MSTDFKQSNGMREFSKKMLVLITDGKSNRPNLTLAQTELLHADQRKIQVIAIGVGSGVNVPELKSIASSDDNVFILENFDMFDKVKERISSAICEAEVRTTQWYGLKPACICSQSI